jgi:predicted ABC-type transport system involved in lysophospholipase L1 biosynthesis ATPase subunit
VGLAAALLETPLAGVTAGDRLRVHLARAIATTPEVLLLEHPTVGVAREQVAPFADVVARIAGRRGLTLLAITEDSVLADGLASTHYRLQGGTGALVPARGWRRWF